MSTSMSSSNLASTATSSPSHVRFNPELGSPSSDGRPRQGSLPYPTVAQSKGSADRRYSFDLFWKLDTLSAVSDVAPVDVSESPKSANEMPTTKTTEKDQAPSPLTAKKARSHNYVVLGRKQTEALLKAEETRLMAK